MSALRENLSQNMQTLRERLQRGMNKTASKRPPEFQSLTDQEVAAINTALRNKDVQVEVHVGPKTDVGSPNRKGSMLGKLRDELVSSGELGSDRNKVLATDTVPITQDSIDRAANPAKTSSDVGK